ncbi:hypothetical protein A2U01_0014002 [Trifolium medium]|uniref:Cullin-like protein n=1 Tax=Trifolium medium TaxID=97028 RepID=A0A392N1J4_9FABA|nr:hypothetical protein [Trifolium medium]
MVDFESLKINGFDFEEMITAQGWNMYFEMLNGPIYTGIVKEFWMKARVFDKVSARMEEEKAIKGNPSLAGKTRAEMGLCEFNETVIKSVLAGIEITISRAHLAKLLSLKDSGKRIADYKNEVYYRQSIKKELYEDENLAGKSKCMKDFYVVLFKVLINNIILRGGGTDTISWEHQHLLYFLNSKKKVNLVDLLFEYLCHAIRESNFRHVTTLVYPGLLSDLFYQTKLVKVLKKIYPGFADEERA